MNDFTMPEALELLKDGLITFDWNDLSYFPNAGVIVDHRTILHKFSRPTVFSLGQTVTGHWLYVCPSCGHIHAMKYRYGYCGAVVPTGCKSVKRGRFNFIVDHRWRSIPANHFVFNTGKRW